MKAILIPALGWGGGAAGVRGGNWLTALVHSRRIDLEPLEGSPMLAKESVVPLSATSWPGCEPTG